MLWCQLGVAALLLAAAPSPRREQPPLPREGFPPEVVFAQAFPKGGAVQLRFFIPIPATGPATREVERDGRIVRQQIAIFVYTRRLVVDLEVDDKQVRAFDVEGKPIAPQQLLKRLAKLSPVVLFKVVKEGVPDPYYLRVLKEGTVVITAPHDKVTPQWRRD
jgi:hypothetical protein